MKRLLGSIVIFGIIVGGWYLATEQKSSKDLKQTNVGVVKKQDLFQRVNIAGAIVANRTVQFVPPYEGYVQNIFVKLGAMVKKGDPVIKISSGPDDEAFPIRAPFSGMVVQIMHSEGEFVLKTPTDAVVRIDDISKLFAESEVPELDYSKLRLGQEVIIKASAVKSRNYKGKIVEISQAAGTQDRWEKSKVLFPIKVEILDSDAQLKPGMSVVIDVITQKALDVATLMHEFVHKEADQYYVIFENGERRNIKTGLRTEDSFEVVSGVKDGDRVRQVDLLAL
jgi:multidrug efflux pump subunit AcrA (membrane-fusion protein)